MLRKHFGQAGRAGQSHFRAEMFRAYTKQCALTGCQIEETLEAAHIIPYCLTQNHEPWNGFLLRSDVNRLFDLNLLRIDPITLVAQFDRRILEREPSYQMIEGKMIQTPQIGLSSSFSPYERPWRQALEWRRDYYQQLVEGFLP